MPLSKNQKKKDGYLHRVDLFNLRVVVGTVLPRTIDNSGAITGGFGVVASSSLAIDETVANVEVRSKDRAGIAPGTDFAGAIGFF
jgi:hypothetical protein